MGVITDMQLSVISNRFVRTNPIWSTFINDHRESSPQGWLQENSSGLFLYGAALIG
jgi:hypothetical protein